ncbi:DNA/RNA non-specific endonuclease [Photorhabdus luminescens]|uniref:DNA/RNA non-specific endonuclease n=1 Tax=Photorhabdus luminescens TaxID=29488 RepID=UPI002240606A|nr:DNA/RNA non-specific endonuclease [Photorhabdus luminescens]MCW7763769.1 DNA/RNA non-specific endonuclease [Photorhabdus luminescens subsp. venezuelensis]
MDEAIKAAKEKGEDTASIFERKRNNLAEQRESVKAECQAHPTICALTLREYANQALDSVDTLIGRLYFDRSVVAFTHEESAKDNAVIDNYTNGTGQSLEYVLNGAKFLGGEDTKFSMTGKSIKTRVHNQQVNPSNSAPEVVVIKTESGKKGNWNKDLNKLQPNTIYHVDGNKTYHTDALTRTSVVESTLKLSKNSRNSYQQTKAGKSGNVGDEGGHLIASIFNGPGEKLNIVPMDGNLNKSAWKKMENKWANALKNDHQVQVKIDISYKDKGTRPDSFSVTYQIGNEQPIREGFINAPGGK